MRVALSAPQRVRLRTVLADPAAYIERLLRAPLWDTQRAICAAIRDGARRLAVKSCHSVGKTFLAGRLVPWWLTRYRDGIVVTTGPSQRQIERQLWREVRAGLAHGLVRFPEPLKASLEIAPDNYAIGFSTDEPDRFSGFHGRRVLVIVDEAQALRPDVWEGIEGLRAGGHVVLLALGNPTIVGGPYHDAFGEARASWTTFSISAFDTPNLAGLVPPGFQRAGSLREADRQLVALLEALSPEELERSAWPTLITRQWVLEKWYEWGAHEHPLWDAKVMGRFPRQGSDSLYPLAWLEDARLRDPAPSGAGPVEAGIDIAGPGEDETVLYIRRGREILDLHHWLDPDPRGQALGVLLDWRAKAGVSLVKVDSVGIGYYFGLHLRDFGFRVALVNVGVPSRDPERFKLLKDELAWALRLRLETGDVAGLVDDQTLAQLAAIRYRLNARGQTTAESKEQMRQRGVTKSPDRAEALILAFAPGFDDAGVAIA